MDRPLRILHITERLWPPGGAERLLADTAAGLAAQGHHSLALVAEDSEPGPDAAMPVLRWPRVLGPRPAWRLRPQLDALLQQCQPDLVHLHNTAGFFSPVLIAHLHRRLPVLRYVHDARLACLRSPSKCLPGGGLCPHAMGLPCLARCYPVTSPGGHRLGDKHTLMAFADLWVTRRLPAVAVGSAYMRMLLRQNGVADDRLHLLPGFTQREGPRCPPQQGLLLAIGRFDGIKGLEGLPDLLARLRAPHWQAVLVGDGPNLAATQARAQALGLAGRIRFVGRLEADALTPWLTACQLLLCPTQVPEAFGLVGIEALAHGRPVVGYDLGGVREWLQPHRTGVLVPAGDAAAFAAAVDGLLAEPELAASLGAHGRALVSHRFRPQHHLQPLLNLYRQLAGQRAGTADERIPG